MVRKHAVDQEEIHRMRKVGKPYCLCIGITLVETSTWIHTF